jgi:hypothetical protein
MKNEDVRIFTTNLNTQQQSNTIYAIGIIAIVVIATQSVYALLAATAIMTAIHLYNNNYTVVQESMLVMQDLGVQLTTKYASGKETHVFIDKSKITSVFINEGITLYNVIYYMCFVVQEKDKMVLAFRVK